MISVQNRIEVLSKIVFHSDGRATWYSASNDDDPKWEYFDEDTYEVVKQKYINTRETYYAAELSKGAVFIIETSNRIISAADEEQWSRSDPL